ncbi:hypothetical protein HUSEC41_28647, partial [Escherichia coli O104:H4 str. 01-09591]
MFDGELSFALKLAREMGRPDWLRHSYFARDRLYQA